MKHLQQRTKTDGQKPMYKNNGYRKKETQSGLWDQRHAPFGQYYLEHKYINKIRISLLVIKGFRKKSLE